MCSFTDSRVATLSPKEVNWAKFGDSFLKKTGVFRQKFGSVTPFGYFSSTKRTAWDTD
jgi:hypothetical protein